MKRSHWRCLLAIVCAISLIMTMSGMTAFADEIDGEDSFIADVGTEVTIQEENEMVSDSENYESEVSDTSVTDDSEMPEIEQGENIDSSGESDTAESGEDVVNEDPTAVEAEEALPENLVGASNQAAMWFMDDLWITQLPGVGSHYGTNNFDVIGSQNNNIKAPFDCTIVDIIEGYQAGNTVIIQSLSPVRYANGNEDYMSMAFGHDNDISDCYVGRTLAQGEVFYQTGNFGQVTGIHSHVTCMAGKYTDHDRGFQNSGYTYNGSPTYSFANAVHPVDALFISPSTNIVDSQGLVFKVPANTPEPEPHGQTVSVGENVTAGFDSETGTVTFYSQGGTLPRDWLKRIGISKDTVKAITFSNDSDVMYLPSNCSCLFELFINLQSTNFSKVDTSNVTNMYAMFHGCSSLQTLDVSGFDTSNVTTMEGMFYGCSSLQTLDVSGFDTSNVTTMERMFNSCSGLQTLDVSGFDTSNVTDMEFMFCECSGLQTLDVSGFDTSNVSYIGDMFYECSSLQSLDVSGFDTSNVTDMSEMFCGCSSLQTLDVSMFDTSNVTEMSNMFRWCSDLQTLDISGFNTSNVEDMFHMFGDCSSLQTLDVSGFDTSNVTIMDEMFEGCSSLQTLDVSGFDTSNVMYMHSMFRGCSSLQELDLSSFDMGEAYANEMLLNCSNLLVLMTPLNVRWTVNLPSTFADASGTEYDSLPKGLSESIRLTRKGAVIPTELKILSLSDDFYGKTGTPASFHIEVEGTANISYQWQYRTAGTTNWKTPSQTSAKTADYVFTLKPSYDNIEVRCIVSDDSGNEVISDTRKANVFAFTSQPKDAIASAGEVVNFEVSSIGNNVTYQWYYKRPNSTWKKTTVAGATTAVLPITAGTKNDGTSYRCVITDEAGNKINSTAALLTLDNISLQVTGISEDAYDVNGKSVTFHVDAVGNGNLTYQWQYKLAGETKWRTPSQASAKTADYVFKLKPSYDNIEVRCIVKDATGNSVTSDVRKANVFAITGQPQDAELELGEQTTFSVEAAGKDLAYQWFYMRPEGSWKKVTVAGANTANLVITANTKNDGTKFQCRITDGLGNILVSSAALLTQK